MLKAATDYIVSEKGQEVISDRHQKDYKKDEIANEEVITEEAPIPATENFTDVSFEDI
jgi:hypothetical protein